MIFFLNMCLLKKMVAVRYKDNDSNYFTILHTIFFTGDGPIVGKS